MKRPGDHKSEMRTADLLDDATAEALLRGEPVSAELAPLSDTVEAMRHVADQPPAPSARLAARMSSGDFSGVPAAPFGRDERRSPSKLAVMSLRVKVVGGVAVLLSGVTGVAAANGMPDVVGEKVRDVIESVTPIEFDDPAEVDEGVTDDAEGSGTGENHEGQDAGESAPHEPEPDDDDAADPGSGSNGRSGTAADNVPDDAGGSGKGPAEVGSGNPESDHPGPDSPPAGGQDPASAGQDSGNAPDQPGANDDRALPDLPEERADGGSEQTAPETSGAPAEPGEPAPDPQTRPGGR